MRATWVAEDTTALLGVLDLDVDVDVDPDLDLDVDVDQKKARRHPGDSRDPALAHKQLDPGFRRDDGCVALLE